MSCPPMFLNPGTAAFLQRLSTIQQARRSSRKHFGDSKSMISITLWLSTFLCLHCVRDLLRVGSQVEASVRVLENRCARRANLERQSRMTCTERRVVTHQAPAWQSSSLQDRVREEVDHDHMRAKNKAVPGFLMSL